jgi:hypothetical protein
MSPHMEKRTGQSAVSGQDLHRAIGYLATGQLYLFQTNVAPEKPKRALATMYEDCAVDMIWHSARHAEAVADQIDLVFARLGEFSLDRLEKNFGDFQLVDRQLHSINVGDPKGCMPLQAADFVAYDVQC